MTKMTKMTENDTKWQKKWLKMTQMIWTHLKELKNSQNDSKWSKMTKNDKVKKSDKKWHKRDPIHVPKLMWYLKINYSAFKTPKNAKKVKFDGRTDGPTDGQTDGPTDRHSDL